MQATRRTLLQSITVMVAGCFSGIGWAASPKPLSFLATGDWGQPGDHQQKDVARRMGETAARIDSQFVVAVGDNFYDAGVESVSDFHWKALYENVYTARSLQTPWYAIFGNHDYGGVPQAQLDYAKTSPKWRMPARYYSQSTKTPDGTAVDLFFLDTSPMVQSYKTRTPPSLFSKNCSEQDPAKQLAWLDAALASSTAPWKLVFGHHPVFSGGQHGDTKELVKDLNPILKRHGVQLYVYGHDHDLQHIEREGITHVGTGAGASTREVKAVNGTAFCAGRAGFTAYRVTADKMVIDFVDYTGVTLHTAEVPRVRTAMQRAA